MYEFLLILSTYLIVESYEPNAPQQLDYSNPKLKKLNVGVFFIFFVPCTRQRSLLWPALVYPNRGSENDSCLHVLLTSQHVWGGSETDEGSIISFLSLRKKRYPIIIAQKKKKQRNKTTAALTKSNFVSFKTPLAGSFVARYYLISLSTSLSRPPLCLALPYVSANQVLL